MAWKAAYLARSESQTRACIVLHFKLGQEGKERLTRQGAMSNPPNHSAISREILLTNICIDAEIEYKT